MRDTHKFENQGTGTLIPLKTPGKSASIARTFNHLVSMIASLQEAQNRCLVEHVDHHTPTNPVAPSEHPKLTQTQSLGYLSDRAFQSFGKQLHPNDIKGGKYSHYARRETHKKDTATKKTEAEYTDFLTLHEQAISIKAPEDQLRDEQQK